MPYGGRGDPVSVSRVISAMVSTHMSLSADASASRLPCPLLLPFLISPGTQPCPALAKGIVGGVSLPLFSPCPAPPHPSWLLSQLLWNVGPNPKLGTPRIHITVSDPAVGGGRGAGSGGGDRCLWEGSGGGDRCLREGWAGLRLARGKGWWQGQGWGPHGSS